MAVLIYFLVIAGVVILFFALLVLVTVVIPEKFREKEGKRERIDIIGADPSSINRSYPRYLKNAKSSPGQRMARLATF